MPDDKVQRNNFTHATMYTSLYAIFQIIGLLIIAGVYYWITSFRGGFSFTEAKTIFNWHPLLMTIGFVYLLANSLLHYRTFRNCKKQNLKNQHAILHACALILIILAALAALASHLYASPPIQNLYSLHSWIGVLTVVMFLLQFVAGIVSFLYPGISAQYREAVAPYHVFFGVASFVLAVATAVLGLGEKLIFTLDKDYKKYPTEGIFGNILGLLFVVYGILVVYMVTKEEFKRRPQPEYEPLL